MSEDIDPDVPPQRLLAERVRDILEHSSDSVTSELDHAQGWLREAGLGSPGNALQVEGVAAGVGALANAWGRLVFLARSNGTYPSVRRDLDEVMERMVELWTRLLQGVAEARDADALHRMLDRMRALRDVVVGGVT
jgi:hypothetical protein